MVGLYNGGGPAGFFAFFLFLFCLLLFSSSSSESVGELGGKVSSVAAVSGGEKMEGYSALSGTVTSWKGSLFVGLGWAIGEGRSRSPLN